MTPDRLADGAKLRTRPLHCMEMMKMKRKKMSVLTAAAFIALLSLAGCSDNDGAAEEAGEAVDEAVEDAGDAVEDATD